MKKIYFLLSFFAAGLTSMGQCPILEGAMINSCGSLANNEGINEFVVFTTTAAATAGDYQFYYGSTTSPVTTPTNTMFGSNAGPKTSSTGKFTASGGCTIHEVTSPSTVIPALSRVIFIPANFDTAYDVSGICSGGSIYVVYITTTANSWNPNGTMANAPSANRYLQVTNGNNTCASGVRSYNNSWPINTDGNFVAWTPDGTAIYLNNGCTNITTPVHLLSFNATAIGKNTQVNWQTAKEENAKNFVIERSSDGISFGVIGTVPAAGNSQSVKNYSFTDHNIPTGPSYYRLKMVDMDGTVKYSQIVRIVMTVNGFAVTNLFPQPASNKLGISWNSPKAGKTTVQVYDYAGRLLLNGQVTAAAGMNYQELAVDGLPKGQYLLKLVRDKETVTSRFSKL